MVQAWNLLRTQDKVSSLGVPQNKPKEASRWVSPRCLPTSTQRDTHGHKQQHGNLCSASGSISQAVHLSIHGLSAWAGPRNRRIHAGKRPFETCSKPLRAGENLEISNDSNGMGQGKDE